MDEMLEKWENTEGGYRLRICDAFVINESYIYKTVRNYLLCGTNFWKVKNFPKVMRKSKHFKPFLQLVPQSR
jgi:hypothetical protein